MFEYYENLEEWEAREEWEAYQSNLERDERDMPNE